jgi:hypothetical protein
MNELFSKLKSFYEGNKVLALIITGVVLVMFTPLGKMFRGTSRRRRRKAVRVVYKPRTRRRITIKAKKPWQVKGSLAAKRRMAQIRRKRR